MIARTLGAAALLCSLFVASHHAAAQADLALILAVDVSSSIDDARFKLQREGIARGLESRDVLEAIATGPRQTIELAVVEWSEEQIVLVDWTIVRNRADMESVVDALRTQPRPRVGYSTNVGGGIGKAIALFDSAPLLPERKVIDVSGDGQQNNGKIAAEQVRDAALAQNITINGLPITSGEEPEVDRWYKAHVVGGDASFMIVANGYDSFSDAMRKKLVLEVAGAAPPIRLGELN
jgi:uncharacterized protein DUF1194